MQCMPPGWRSKSLVMISVKLKFSVICSDGLGVAFSLQALLSTQLPAFLAALLSPCFWASHLTGIVNIWKSGILNDLYCSMCVFQHLDQSRQSPPGPKPHRLVIFHLAICAWPGETISIEMFLSTPVRKQKDILWVVLVQKQTYNEKCALFLILYLLNSPSFTPHPYTPVESCIRPGPQDGVLPVVPERIVLLWGLGLGPRADDLATINSTRRVLFGDMCLYRLNICL